MRRKKKEIPFFCLYFFPPSSRASFALRSAADATRGAHFLSITSCRGGQEHRNLTTRSVSAAGGGNVAGSSLILKTLSWRKRIQKPDAPSTRDITPTYGALIHIPSFFL